jgi:hypothetical protein
MRLFFPRLRLPHLIFSLFNLFGLLQLVKTLHFVSTLIFFPSLFVKFNKLM